MASEPSASDFSPEYLAYDEGGTVIGVSAAMMPLSVAIVAVRFWARKRKQTALGLDDWIILASVPILWSVAILGFFEVKFGGVGKHLQVNLMEDSDRYGRCLLYLFIGEITYGTVLCTIKAAILIMYHRIFPTRFMKFGGYALGAMTLAWWLAVVFVTVFQCSPIEKTWKPFMERGKCVDKGQFFLGNAIPNIITDVLILALPVYEISRLHIRKAQKIAIISIFLMGGFVVVVSCIRLKVIIDVLNGGENADFTVLIGRCWIWTVVEPTVGMLSASLPTMQPVMQLLFGRWIGESSMGQSDTSGLVTIGGTGPKHLSRNNTVNRDGPFKRLNDNDSAEEPVLWPENYAQQRNVTVEGKGTTSEGNTDMIPLNTITVQKGLSWTETRQNGDHGR